MECTSPLLFDFERVGFAVGLLLLSGVVAGVVCGAISLSW